VWASTAIAATDGGVPDAAGDRLARGRAALGRCGPGDPFAACVDGLRAAQLDVTVAEGRAVVGLDAPFFAVVLDPRDGPAIVDVAFRGVDVGADLRGDIARFVEDHAGAYPFSEDCPDGAQFCGVFYPKQKGGTAGVEVGVGLVQVRGKPAWRRPPSITLDGQRVYAAKERLLDVARTRAGGVVVQFSLPLGRAGAPSGSPPLLRPAFDLFARSPYVRPH
jgi:hypothetical protein